VGLLHLSEELPRVGRERLDVAALSLGVEGVEGERALPASRHSREDDQSFLRDLQRDALEIVLAGSLHEDVLGFHGFLARVGGPCRIRGGRRLLNR
jgi:hypothetical protein